MNIRDLGGHSGCRILLCEPDDGSEAFVRKISSTLQYNSRLKIQAEKQANHKNPHISTPLVLQAGTTEEGLYFFDMEYVRGITLSEYMKQIEIDKVGDLVKQIIAYIVVEAQSGGATAPQVFIDKIHTLRNKLRYDENTIIQKALQMLQTHDWSHIPQSACHGDMTMENIIVKGDRLYFIDFLDSFYDSWVLDLGTLMQDAQVMWSYRFIKPTDINTVIRLMVFRDIMLDSIKKQWHDAMIQEVYYALLLKLIRIFPYTKDKLTYTFLTQKTESVMRLLERSYM